MNLFNSIRVPRLRRNTFNLSHEFKFSGSFGKLIPILCQEVVPGDTFRVNSEVFVRMAPMLAPLMHRINVFVHFFFVPTRLVWTEWEDFITGGEDGTDTPVMPTVSLDNESGAWSFFTINTLADYLGLPVNYPGQSYPPTSLTFCDIPFRVYWKVVSDYYIDENLDDLSSYKLEEWFSDSGIRGIDPSDPSTLRYVLPFNRAWEKDYFTSALPWAQRGDSVTLPMTGNADINFVNPNFPSILRNVDGSEVSSGAYVGSPGGVIGSVETGGSNYKQAAIDNSANLEVDLSNVNSATINELRRAIKAQEWLERSATGGARYIEQILAHFGVRSSDARLQRAQYLGGGMAPLRVSEVLQTSSTDSQPSPLGDMAGHAYAVGNTNRFKRFFEEHGYIMGIMSILPRSSYQQGMPRMFLRQDKFDFYWPEFAHIGEQEVYNGELYWEGNDQDSQTFGYQSRYAEYKTAQSRVAGSFKSTLNFWHAGRIFNGRPTLDTSFVHCDPSQFTRLFATADLSTDEQFYVNVLHNIRARRPMPRFGTPSF